MAENAKNVVDTKKGSAGPASRPDSTNVPAMAEHPGLLTQEELDERQENIGQTRKPSGPPLRGTANRARRTRAAPVAPETEVEPPKD